MDQSCSNIRKPTTVSFSGSEDDRHNWKMQAFHVNCLETQGSLHSQDKVPILYEPIRAQRPSSLQLGDIDIQARTLPPIFGLKSHLHVQSILNSPANTDSGPGSLSLSKKTTGPTGLARAHLTRLLPCEGDVNPTPPQSVSQDCSLRTQAAPPTASTDQTESFTSISEVPMSSITAQSQDQIMTLDTEQGPIQVPVDVQAASKVAKEKRERNSTASNRYRNLRKVVIELETERDHYLKERNFFRHVVQRHNIHITPRPPSPTPSANTECQRQVGHASISRKPRSRAKQ